MRKVFFEIKQGVISVIRLIFSLINNGERCVVCNKITPVIPVCKTCLKNRFSVQSNFASNRCVTCGKELTSNFSQCSSCRDNPILVSTDNVIPLFSYRLWNKELLFLWKIKEERVLSSVFADFVFQALKKIDCNIVVPVPPRKGKIQRNGWDQINELCKFLQFRYGVKILNILERNSVLQQKKLNRNERLNTIKNAYSIASNKVVLKELKKNNLKKMERVVLLDDVCTTGATLESCAKILKENGINKVDVITLFTVD